MFNREGFNILGFNQLEMAGEEITPILKTEGTLTMVCDTEIIPIEYIGERQMFANSPWVPFSGFDSNQWLLTRDNRMCIGANDGFVYEYGVGTSDNGRMIRAHYVIPPITLGSEDLLKRLRWINVDLSAKNDSFIRIYYKIDRQPTWNLLCELNQEEIMHPFVDFPKPLFREISIRIENTYTGSEYVINGITLDIVVRGQQKVLQKGG